VSVAWWKSRAWAVGKGPERACPWLGRIRGAVREEGCARCSWQQVLEPQRIGGEGRDGPAALDLGQIALGSCRIVGLVARSQPQCDAGARGPPPLDGYVQHRGSTRSRGSANLMIHRPGARRWPREEGRDSAVNERVRCCRGAMAEAAVAPGGEGRPEEDSGAPSQDVGDREQDGIGSPFVAWGGVVIGWAWPRHPSAQQPTTSRVSAFSSALCSAGASLRPRRQIGAGSPVRSASRSTTFLSSRTLPRQSCCRSALSALT
jgi:hypothetical protein